MLEIDLVLSANFPGRAEIKTQLLSTEYESIEENGSLKITPRTNFSAMVEKTIPVEANPEDIEGILIQILLHTRKGIAFMLEILREDSRKLVALPPAISFKVMVLGK